MLGLISGKFDGIEELHKNDVEPTQISLDDLIQNSSETQNKETVLTKDTEENYVSFDFNDDSQSFQLTIDNDFFEQETEIEKNVKKPVVEIAKRKLVIVSSDDEPEENVSLKKKKKKTKKRKLDFSGNLGIKIFLTTKKGSHYLLLFEIDFYYINNYNCNVL